MSNILVDSLDTDEFELVAKMLIVTLWEGGYPHEIICYMFNKHIEKSDRDSSITPAPGVETWFPREIVEELSDMPLWALCKRIKEEYIINSFLPEDVINAWFLRLDLDMHRKLHQMIKHGDQMAYKRWGRILDELVGRTRLKDYFTSDPSRNISDWSYRVFLRMSEFITKGHWTERPIEELCTEVKRLWISRVEKD